MRGPVLILCTAALLAGCRDDEDETTVVETTPETAPTAYRCGRIPFNPSTDSGAASITAVGTDCETARAVARAARNAADELSYHAKGFRCAGLRTQDAGLASIDWFCVGADRETVNFVTT